jgi:putative transposase
MSEYRRARIAGGTYFFTLVTFDRQAFLTTPAARACLRHAFRETLRCQPFHLDAICLLPDHLHCIWTLPEGDSDYPGRWNRIKGLFSKHYREAAGCNPATGPSRRCKGEAQWWQRRYWEHCIRNEADLAHHLDYLHFNPVKHGYVAQPSDWPWSSFLRHVRAGRYVQNWGRQEPVGPGSTEGFGE